jgi:hypothetical protein
MKRILFATMLAAMATSAFAQSTTGQDAQDAATTPMAQSVPQEQVASSTDDPAKVDVNDRNCLRSTGSLITANQNARNEKAGKPPVCANASGRSYTSEDIHRTGAMNTVDALRQLDTSIR